MMQRTMPNRNQPFTRPTQRRPKKLLSKKTLMLAIIAVLVLGTAIVYAMHSSTAPKPQSVSTTTSTKRSTSATQTVTPKPNACAANTEAIAVYISITQRHLWACSHTTQQYDSAVVTGMESLPADLTPTGTYHIYSKQTNLYLNGSDSTGSWHDYVYYWMPFLSNQYGVYGFHDATWRKPGDFGTISPYSSNASHGCVELPLATAKWLYNWASVGTTVVIKS